MRWEDMVLLEPRLGTIIQAARKAHGTGNYDQLYESYKREISELVGWTARTPELRNQNAYETTIKRLSWALG